MRPAFRVVFRSTGIDFLNAVFIRGSASPLSPRGDRVSLFFASPAVLPFDEGAPFDPIEVPVDTVRHISLGRNEEPLHAQNALEFVYNFTSPPLPLGIIYPTCAVGSHKGTEEPVALFSADLTVRPSGDIIDIALPLLRDIIDAPVCPAEFFSGLEFLSFSPVYFTNGPSTGLNDVISPRHIAPVCPVQALSGLEILFSSVSSTGAPSVHSSDVTSRRIAP